MLMTDKFKCEDWVKVQEICDFFDLGELLSCIPLTLTASCKPLFRLQTTKGCHKITGYSKLEKKQLENVIYGKKIFSIDEIPLYLPYLRNQYYFYEDEKNEYTIESWIEGQVLTLEQINIKHIDLMAVILAKIHKLNLKLPQAIAVLKPDLMSFSGNTILQEAKEYDQWQRQFKKHAYMIEKNLVISHGDLLPQNVVWEAEDKPILIDWENMGLINQDIDLFNTAINWAGIESGKLNKILYDRFIFTYLKENPREIQINQSVIAASLGSWLNWLVLNHHNNNTETVNITLGALRELTREFLIS